SIVASMRTAKWRIREALSDIPGLTFRRIPDPDGDSGCFLLATLETPALCRKFADALKAEGIHGPEGSMACISMEDWHFHWYFNNLSLVNRRGVTPSGWPWTDPANEFAADYRYDRGTLPICDD